MNMQLCNERGIVADEWLAQHNRLKAAAGFPTDADPFGCTGAACYVAGEHITCTNEIHNRPASKIGNTLMRIDASHVATLANEVYEMIQDEPQDDPNIVSLRVSLDACKRVATFLYGSRWYTASELLKPAGIKTCGGGIG